MAFQDVNVSSFKKASDIAVGESITAYTVRFEPSSKYPEQTNIVMQSEGGLDQFVLLASGNIKYLIRDNKIKPGLLTKITRLPDEKVKGMNSKKFQVQQDAEQTLEDGSFAALGETTTAPTTSPVVNAVERNIKAQANKLASSMKRN